MSSFNVQVGEEYYFEVEKSSVGYYIPNAGKSIKEYSGFKINEENYDAEEIVKVRVTEINGESISWETSIGDNSVSDNALATADSSEFDIVIYTPDYSVVNNYLDPFLIQPILGNNATNWDSFESIYGSFYAKLYTEYAIKLANPSYSDVTFYYYHTYNENSTVAEFIFEYFLAYTRVYSADWHVSYFFETESRVGYDIETGVLIHYNIDNSYQIVEEELVTIPTWGDFISSTCETVHLHSTVSRTDAPIGSGKSPFAEFMAENMWYFIEGAFALCLIGITIPTTIVLTNRNGTTSKKTTSKKKKTKK